MGPCLLVICLLLPVAAFSIRRSSGHASFAELAHRESDDRTWAFSTLYSSGDGFEDIRRFADELFGQVIGVTDEEARHNTCNRFGTHCEKHVRRAQLVADYAYSMYHLIPPGEDEQIPFVKFKGELMGNLTGEFRGIRSHVQGFSKGHSVRDFLDTKGKPYNEVQDFQWWVFGRPAGFHYTRRVSINVPAKARPAFSACILRELLEKDVVQGMKLAMIHAPGFEGRPVPLSVSDNIILYLSRRHNLDSVVEGVRACEPAGGFGRPPGLMRLLGDTGAQIAVGADDSLDGKSYGSRLEDVFRRAYWLMVTKDRLPPCCRKAMCWEGLHLLLKDLWSNGTAVTIQRYRHAVCAIAMQSKRQEKFSMLP